MGNYISSEEPEPVSEVKETLDETDAASVIQKNWKTKQAAAEFKWPENLYLELLDLAETDQMVSYVALLFQAARDTKLKGLDAIWSPASESAPEGDKPKLTVAQLQTIVESNMEALTKSKAFTAEPQDMVDILARIGKRTSGRKISLVGLNVAALKTKDMAYCIIKDDSLKRVTVVFPANNSALKDDWILKRSYPQRNERLFRALKAKISGDRITHVKVHDGFSQYLTKGGVGNAILEDLLPILTTSSTYKLYVTGHGMGAALASLFAFQMAFDANIAMPVSNINFGSPRVGDANYWRSCQLLEISGKLRTCRVVTDTDTLPTIPAKEDYAHAGYQLKLSESEKPVEYYASVKDDGSLRKGAFVSTKKFNASKSTQQSYLQLIESNADALKEMNLNQLYEAAGVTAFVETK